MLLFVFISKNYSSFYYLYKLETNKLLSFAILMTLGLNILIFLNLIDSDFLNTNILTASTEEQVGNNLTSGGEGSSTTPVRKGSNPTGGGSNPSPGDGSKPTPGDKKLSTLVNSSSLTSITSNTNSEASYTSNDVKLAAGADVLNMRNILEDPSLSQ